MIHARRLVASSVLIASLGFGGLSQGDTLDVPGEFPTIQAAIDFATDGDEVVIAPGEYFENINFNNKAITVRSTDPTNPATILATIINGGGLDTVVTCDSGEGADTVLSGLLITNGFAEDGGGMLIDNGSSPTVTNCSFAVNMAANEGGGMANGNGSSPTVTNCAFNGNSASLAGGMSNSLESSPMVTNCTFSGNNADFGGGGMYNSLKSRPMVTNCTFSGNNADFVGGGMVNEASNPAVTNCTFSGNTAETGGGMFNLEADPTVTNCTFFGNTALVGGGMFNLFGSNPTVTNCSFVANTADDAVFGGGMFSDSIPGPTVTNSVFCLNSPDQVFGNFDDAGGNAISDDYCVPLPPVEPESDCDVADVNGDGLVDPLDVGFILARFGCEG